MPKFYGYVRVSTEEQGKSGLGLDAQKHQLSAYYEYALKEKYEQGGFFADKGVSGGKPFFERSQGFRLNQVLEPGDVVVFAKIDRGFRNTRDALQTIDNWQAKGIRVVFLDVSLDTGTPQGRAFLTILAAFSEMEREMISQRTKAALAELRRRGNTVNTRAPYGFKVIKLNGKNRRIVPDPIARNCGAVIVKLHDDKGWDFETIYWYCAQNKIKNRFSQELSLSWIKVAYWKEIELRKKEEREREAHQGLGAGVQGPPDPRPAVARPGNGQAEVAVGGDRGPQAGGGEAGGPGV